MGHFQQIQFDYQNTFSERFREALNDPKDAGRFKNIKALIQSQLNVIRVTNKRNDSGITVARSIAEMVDSLIRIM